MYVYVARYVAGVIARERTEGFMRMLWFACRGNVFVKHADIDEPLGETGTVSRDTFSLYENITQV